MDTPRAQAKVLGVVAPVPGDGRTPGVDVGLDEDDEAERPGDSPARTGLLETPPVRPLPKGVTLKAVGGVGAPPEEAAARRLLETIPVLRPPDDGTRPLLGVILEGEVVLVVAVRVTATTVAEDVVPHGVAPGLGPTGVPSGAGEGVPDAAGTVDAMVTRVQGPQALLRATIPDNVRAVEMGDVVAEVVAIEGVPSRPEMARLVPRAPDAGVTGVARLAPSRRVGLPRHTLGPVPLLVRLGTPGAEVEDGDVLAGLAAGDVDVRVKPDAEAVAHVPTLGDPARHRDGSQAPARVHGLPAIDLPTVVVPSGPAQVRDVADAGVPHGPDDPFRDDEAADTSVEDGALAVVMAAHAHADTRQGVRLPHAVILGPPSLSPRPTCPVASRVGRPEVDVTDAAAAPDAYLLVGVTAKTRRHAGQAVAGRGVRPRIPRLGRPDTRHPIVALGPTATRDAPAPIVARLAPVAVGRQAVLGVDNVVAPKKGHVGPVRDGTKRPTRGVAVRRPRRPPGVTGVSGRDTSPRRPEAVGHRDLTWPPMAARHVDGPLPRPGKAAGTPRPARPLLWEAANGLVGPNGPSLRPVAPGETADATSAARGRPPIAGAPDGRERRAALGGGVTGPAPPDDTETGVLGRPRVAPSDGRRPGVPGARPPFVTRVA